MNARRAKKLRREVMASDKYGVHDYRVRQYRQKRDGAVVADPIRQRYKQRKREVKRGR